MQRPNGRPEYGDPNNHTAPELPPRLAGGWENPRSPRVHHGNTERTTESVGNDVAQTRISPRNDVHLEQLDRCRKAKGCRDYAMATNAREAHAHAERHEEDDIEDYILHCHLAAQNAQARCKCWRSRLRRQRHDRDEGESERC